MTVVSKFSIAHIASRILLSIISGLFFAAVVPVFSFIFFEFDYYEFKYVYLYQIAEVAGIVGFIFSFIFILDPVQIIVTDEHILFRNLIFRTVLRVEYDEIVDVVRDFSMDYGGPGKWSPTSVYTRYIKLRNGKSISFDDNTYKNFKKIDSCILENIRKREEIAKKKNTL